MFNPRDINPTRNGLLPASQRQRPQGPQGGQFQPQPLERSVSDSIVPPDRSLNNTPLAGHRYGPASDSSLQRLSRVLLQGVNVGGGARVARIGAAPRPFANGDRTARNSNLGALEENPAAPLPMDPSLQAQMFAALASHGLKSTDYLFGDEDGWIRQDMNSGVKRNDARSVAERFGSFNTNQKHTIEVMLAFVSSFGVQTTDVEGTPVRMAALHLHNHAPGLFPPAEDVDGLGAANKAVAQCYRVSRFMSAVQRAYEWGWISF